MARILSHGLWGWQDGPDPAYMWRVPALCVYVLTNYWTKQALKCGAVRVSRLSHAGLRRRPFAPLPRRAPLAAIGPGKNGRAAERRKADGRARLQPRWLLT